MDDLPLELIAASVALLEPRDVLAAGACSRGLYDLCSSADSLWEAMAPSLGLVMSPTLEPGAASAFVKHVTNGPASLVEGTYEATQVLARHAGLDRRFFAACDVFSTAHTEWPVVVAGSTAGELSIFSPVPGARPWLSPLDVRPVRRFRGVHSGMIMTVAGASIGPSGRELVLSGGEDGAVVLTDISSALAAASASGPAAEAAAAAADADSQGAFWPRAALQRPAECIVVQRPIDPIGTAAAVVSSAVQCSADGYGGPGVADGSGAHTLQCPVAAVGDAFGRIDFIDLERCATVFRAAGGHMKSVAALAWAPEGHTLGLHHLASGSFDGTVRIYDARAPLARAAALAAPVVPAGAARGGGRPDEPADADGNAAVLAGGILEARLPAALLTSGGASSGGGITGASAAGTASASSASPYRVYDVAFSPRGALLAAACGDGSVRLWDVRRPNAPLFAGPGAGLWAKSVAFAADGRALLVGGGDHRLRCFDVGAALAHSMRPLRAQQGPSPAAAAASASAAQPPLPQEQQQLQNPQHVQATQPGRSPQGASPRTGSSPPLAGMPPAGRPAPLDLGGSGAGLGAGAGAGSGAGAGERSRRSSRRSSLSSVSSTRSEGKATPLVAAGTLSGPSSPRSRPAATIVRRSSNLALSAMAAASMPSPAAAAAADAASPASPAAESFAFQTNPKAESLQQTAAGQSPVSQSQQIIMMPAQPEASASASVPAPVPASAPALPPLRVAAASALQQSPAETSAVDVSISSPDGGPSLSMRPSSRLAAHMMHVQLGHLAAAAALEASAVRARSLGSPPALPLPLPLDSGIVSRGISCTSSVCASPGVGLPLGDHAAAAAGAGAGSALAVSPLPPPHLAPPPPLPSHSSPALSLQQLTPYSRARSAPHFPRVTPTYAAAGGGKAAAAAGRRSAQRSPLWWGGAASASARSPVAPVLADLQSVASPPAGAHRAVSAPNAGHDDLAAGIPAGRPASARPGGRGHILSLLVPPPTPSAASSFRSSAPVLSSHPTGQVHGHMQVVRPGSAVSGVSGSGAAWLSPVAQSPISGTSAYDIATGRVSACGGSVGGSGGGGGGSSGAAFVAALVRRLAAREGLPPASATASASGRAETARWRSVGHGQQQKSRRPGELPPGDKGQQLLLQSAQGPGHRGYFATGNDDGSAWEGGSERSGSAISGALFFETPSPTQEPEASPPLGPAPMRLPPSSPPTSPPTHNSNSSGGGGPLVLSRFELGRGGVAAAAAASRETSTGGPGGKASSSSSSGTVLDKKGSASAAELRRLLQPAAVSAAATTAAVGSAVASSLESIAQGVPLLSLPVARHATAPGLTTSISSGSLNFATGDNGGNGGGSSRSSLPPQAGATLMIAAGSGSSSSSGSGGSSGGRSGAGSGSASPFTRSAFAVSTAGTAPAVSTLAQASASTGTSASTASPQTATSSSASSASPQPATADAAVLASVPQVAPAPASAASIALTLPARRGSLSHGQSQVTAMPSSSASTSAPSALRSPRLAGRSGSPLAGLANAASMLSAAGVSPAVATGSAVPAASSPLAPAVAAAQSHVQSAHIQGQGQPQLVQPQSQPSQQQPQPVQLQQQQPQPQPQRLVRYLGTVDTHSGAITSVRCCSGFIVSASADESLAIRRERPFVPPSQQLAALLGVAGSSQSGPGSSAGAGAAADAGASSGAGATTLTATPAVVDGTPSAASVEAAAVVSVVDVTYVASEDGDSERDRDSDADDGDRHHDDGIPDFRHHDDGVEDAAADRDARPPAVSPLILLQARAAAAAAAAAGAISAQTPSGGASTGVATQAPQAPAPAAAAPVVSSSTDLAVASGRSAASAGSTLWQYRPGDKPRHQRMPYASEPLQAGPLAAFLGGGMRVPLSPPRRRPGPLPSAGQAQAQVQAQVQATAVDGSHSQGRPVSAQSTPQLPMTMMITRADAPAVGSRTLAAATSSTGSSSTGSTTGKGGPGAIPIPAVDSAESSQRRGASASDAACPWIAAPLSSFRRPPAVPQSLPACAHRMTGLSTSQSAAAQLQALLAPEPRLSAPAAAAAAAASSAAALSKGLTSPSSSAACLPTEPPRYAGGPRATIIVPFVLRRVHWAQGGSAMEHLRGLLTHTATSS